MQNLLSSAFRVYKMETVSSHTEMLRKRGVRAALQQEEEEGSQGERV